MRLLFSNDGFQIIFAKKSPLSTVNFYFRNFINYIWLFVEWYIESHLGTQELSRFLARTLWYLALNSVIPSPRAWVLYRRCRFQLEATLCVWYMYECSQVINTTLRWPFIKSRRTTCNERNEFSGFFNHSIEKLLLIMWTCSEISLWCV